jgi:hypothetical protein
MKIEQLCEAYNRIARQNRQYGLQTMECSDLTVTTEDLPTPEAAWTRVQALKPVAGWLQFQSWVKTFKDGQLPDPQPEWGSLLDAELIDAAGHSIRLRTVSPAALRLVIAQPRSPGEESGPYLSDTVRQLGTGKAAGDLKYRRYWQLDPDRGAVPVFAAFQGFTR